VQRAAWPAGCPLAIQRLSDLQRLRIRLDDRSQRWPGFIHGRDALQIHHGQLPRGEVARRHALLRACDGQLLDLLMRRAEALRVELLARL
jgi:hypothetical protein